MLAQKNELNENIFIAHASMDFVVSSFHYFLPLFYYRFMLLIQFDTTLSLLSVQVALLYQYFCYSFPIPFFFTFNMKKTPFSIIIIIIVQDILTYFDILLSPCVYIILKYYYFLIFLLSHYCPA